MGTRLGDRGVGVGGWANTTSSGQRKINFIMSGQRKINVHFLYDIIIIYTCYTHIFFSCSVN